jgi:hypothetical protein
VPWKLVGSANVKAGAKVGIKILGGLFDPHYDLGSIDVCTLTAVYFDQAGFHKDKLGLEWGEQIQKAVAFFSAQWAPARQLLQDANVKVARSTSKFRDKVRSMLSSGKRKMRRAYKDVKELLTLAANKFGHEPAKMQQGVQVMPDGVEDEA